MIQELINALISEHKLRRLHFQLLLTNRLDHIDFSHCPNLSNIPHLIGLRCQKLTSLNISNCSWITASSVSSMIENLPQLKKLLLRNTKVNDNVLATIHKFCQNLQVLDVFACPITDVGAINLCGRTHNNSRLCDNFKKLDISATKIGNTGASEILKTFKNLLHLGYADVMEAVTLASGQLGCASKDSENNDLNSQVFQLRTLTATGLKCKEVSPQSVYVACSVCPFITEVIFYQGAINSSLQNLKYLQHLHSLEITSDQAEDVTFFDGLVPLLKEIGSRLYSVGLFDIKDLDLGKLGVLCPALENLKCVMAAFNSVAFYESFLTGLESKQIYRCLKKIMIVVGNDSTNFSAGTFQTMLVNAEHLQVMHLVNVQCMTSELLLQVIKCHGLKSLCKVYMESCNQLTVSGIRELLFCDNPLNSLIVKHCEEITRCDFDNLNRLVHQNNFDLAIEWV
ncbi:uncharacterized protein LOC121384653 isoform X2 [Gigantopelta aegis]|nr:uncharacterized protein LOC121384653 isoform X2 [Gigantopelta aegis]XP_041371069.1 uncharacterized protein LOC121384653 isoform X2 [Gigantopelta aegis]